VNFWGDLFDIGGQEAKSIYRNLLLSMDKIRLKHIISISEIESTGQK
jgi:hypothetical protein